MKLTGYLDESGTHDASPLVVMAGFLGEARQWISFERRARRLFARFQVDIFHCIEVRRSEKDFAGWSIDKKLKFLDEFQHIINETLQVGMVAIISREDYAYYKSLKWPQKVRQDSLYSILFRACASFMIESVIATPQWKNGSEPTLNIIVEQGHKNAPDLTRFYEETKKRIGPHNAMGGLSFGDKANCLPLAAADLLAYTAWGQEVGQKPMGQFKGDMKAQASYRKNFYRLPLDKDTLDLLHDQALRFEN